MVKSHFREKKKEVPILWHIGEDMCQAHRKGTINIGHYFLCFIRFDQDACSFFFPCYYYILPDFFFKSQINIQTIICLNGHLVEMACLCFVFCLGLSWTLTGSTYQVRVGVYISLNGGGTFKQCYPKVCSFGMFPGGSSEWQFMQRVALESCPGV